MEVTHIREENKKLTKTISDLRGKLADLEARVSYKPVFLYIQSKAENIFILFLLSNPVHFCFEASCTLKHVLKNKFKCLEHFTKITNENSLKHKAR